MPRPKAIAFDLGKVLVDFDFSIAARGFAPFCRLNAAEIQQLIDQTPLLCRLETGRMTVEEFIAEVAGLTSFRGTPDDFLKIEFWAKDQAAGRAALNGEWEKMFPDPNARPARHTQALPANSPAQIQCAFTAVIGG